jgi:hypothetical protein
VEIDRYYLRYLVTLKSISAVCRVVSGLLARQQRMRWVPDGAEAAYVLEMRSGSRKYWRSKKAGEWVRRE